MNSEEVKYANEDEIKEQRSRLMFIELAGSLSCRKSSVKRIWQGRIKEEGL